MKIEVLGGGCANCRLLRKNVQDALKALGIKAEIKEVTDYAEIASYGVMSTPALVIGGELKSYGRVPSAEEIKKFLKG
ncbi:thioredoxin family protein [Candidatus Micrarchaeota archaeon]|nr:thioredoxin family protein [Candidatus Micrarchaeota archaeon]